MGGLARGRPDFFRETFREKHPEFETDYPEWFARVFGGEAAGRKRLDMFTRHFPINVPLPEVLREYPLLKKIVRGLKWKGLGENFE